MELPKQIWPCVLEFRGIEPCLQSRICLQTLITLVQVLGVHVSDYLKPHLNEFEGHVAGPQVQHS